MRVLVVRVVLLRGHRHGQHGVAGPRVAHLAPPGDEMTRTPGPTRPRRPGGPRAGGAEGTRTPDPHTASVVRYQLRHSPELLHAPAHAVARTKLHHRSQQQQITWCGRFEDLATDRTCPGSQLMFANHSESPSASIT